MLPTSIWDWLKKTYRTNSFWRYTEIVYSLIRNEFKSYQSLLVYKKRKLIQPLRQLMKSFLLFFISCYLYRNRVFNVEQIDTSYKGQLTTLPLIFLPTIIECLYINVQIHSGKYRNACDFSVFYFHSLPLLHLDPWHSYPCGQS